MHQCPCANQFGQACGAPCVTIEGDRSVNDRGELMQHWRCQAGHYFGVPIVRQHGPCPNCNHRWTEPVRGGDPDKITAAPIEVSGNDLNSIAGQIGLGGCMRYEG